MVKGCVHFQVKNGKILNVFSHLSNLPEEGVIHLVVDKVYSNDGFIESHPMDKNEVSVETEGGIFNLGPNVYE